jgi:hypothetical protein
MKSDEDIHELIRKLQVEPSADTDRKVDDHITKALEEWKKPEEISWCDRERTIGRKVMESKIARIAAAAVILIACFTGLNFWRSTGSGIALADVLARMEQVKAVKYKTTFKVFGSEDPNELWVDERYTYLMSKEYGWISTSEKRDPNGEEITGTIKYRYPHQKIREIQINHTQKRYTRRVTDSQAQNEQSQSQEDSLSSLIKEILSTKHESIGRSIIDGVEVEGFQTTDPNYNFEGYSYKGPRITNIKKDPQSDAKLWVNVKTLLPVRIEYLTSDTYDGGETRSFLQQVDYNFDWDVSVDASAFEAPPIPDGYAIQDRFPELANEENAIGGLKQCVELFGNYPERIDLTYLWAESEKSETTAALRLKEELKELTGLERDNKKMDALKPTRFLNKFYVGLAKKDSAYYGKTVTTRDTDKVLMRWKVSDNEYRIILSNLGAKTVTAEELAELENSQ